ncbi:MAG: Fe-S cluster assembly protein SufD [Pseudomonadota bacterium]
MSVSQILKSVEQRAVIDSKSVKDAIDALAKLGFPARRVERWRYTRSDAFSEYAARALQTERPSSDNAEAALTRWCKSNEIEHYAAFIGGEFREDLSRVPDGFAIQSIDVAPSIGSLDDPADALVWLNTIATQGRYQISVEGKPEQTLHCVHVPLAEQSIAQTRVHLQIAEGADASITDHLVDGDVTSGMLSLITTIDLAARAKLSHARLQACGAETLAFTRIDADIAKGATCRTLTLDTGGLLVRNELNLRLNDVDAAAYLDGIYLSNNKQHIDNHTQVDHASRDTVSRESYRGILRDRSRCVFNGKVLVYEGADGTDSVQSNANLLLSDHAEIDTKPELEIYADDVKCAHGATVGQLDPQSLFYLRARGIDEATATQLLTYAFCRELTAELADPVVRRLADTAIAAEIPNFTALELIA